MCTYTFKYIAKNKVKGKKIFKNQIEIKGKLHFFGLLFDNNQGFRSKVARKCHFATSNFWWYFLFYVFIYVFIYVFMYLSIYLFMYLFI